MVLQRRVTKIQRQTPRELCKIHVCTFDSRDLKRITRVRVYV